MSTRERAYEELRAANPLSDLGLYEATREDAAAFLRTIDGGTTSVVPKRAMPTRPVSRRWLVAGATFTVVLVLGLAALVVASVDDSGSAARPSVGSEPPPLIGESNEPASLAGIRTAVNDGDAARAAELHNEDADCDRFFTTGVESCADWYAFLVGIGTRVIAADCEVGDLGPVCRWTVESEAHRALGIGSVTWDFTLLEASGWGSVVPDGNLFSGRPGEFELDTAVWAAVNESLGPVSDDGVFVSALRTPATLDSDLALVVLDVVESLESGR